MPKCTHFHSSLDCPQDTNYFLLRIRVDHKNVVSRFIGNGESRHTSDPISSCFVLAHLECSHATALFYMSRTGIIVTKYNLDSYFYILQDLDFS